MVSPTSASQAERQIGEDVSNQLGNASPDPRTSAPLSIKTPSASLPRNGHFYASSDQESSIADFLVGGGSISTAGDAEDFFRRYGSRTNDDSSAFGTTSTEEGPSLAKGFIDYISDLEARVRQLEAQLSPRAHEALKTPDTVREEEPVPFEALPYKFEMKFFEAAAELDLSGNFKAERESMSDTFRSHVDERHFLRVAYFWRDVPSNTPARDPMPDDIKLFALRIDSKPIAKFLRSISGDMIERGPVVELIAPFRILIENYHSLRCRMEEVQTEFAKAQSSETREAIDHFHLALQFMDLYLAKERSTYEAVKHATATRINFENLWMLFGFDESIYCPQRRGGQEVENLLGSDAFRAEKRSAPQVYRVLGSIGGLPLIDGVERLGADNYEHQPKTQARPTTVDNMSVSRTGRQHLSIGERFGPLSVYCFHIDYNGKRYGAVRDVFVFKPFEDDIEITSLEAYPIRFLHQASKRAKIHSLEDLAARGRKFVQLTATSHMNYEGWTAADPKEEISSAVMIDVELAFQERPDAAPRLSSLTEFWPKKTSGQTIQIAVSDCVHNERRSRRCNHWRCMRDADVESRRMVAFDAAKRLKRRLEADELASSNADHAESLTIVKNYLEATGLLSLLPGVIRGYALRNRKWISMNLDDIHPVPQADGWKSLVLPAGHKQIVQAMVDTHSAGSPNKRENAHQIPEVDLVRGKGKGCIILIHGAPGVGKTSTAECVAAYTDRPLFPITCGDIGYEPQEVEKKLEQLFNLASKWGCVLLLDEADVFLAKRNKDDVKRNGLVSVFLRILEYYSGILFLTTNRVGAIDDAFRSRLHLTLYYPRLDAEKSIKIWKTNIKRVQELSRKREEQGWTGIGLDKKRLLQFAADNFSALQWNGRQIRNSFQTALALAEFEARKNTEKDHNENTRTPKLSVRHFQTIALASQEFDEYLQQTHGRSEEKQAHYDKMRVEDFKESGARLSLKIRESSSEEDDTASSDDDSSPSNDSESDISRKKKKGLGRVKSRDSVLYRPNMNRQRSRDSIISLKKQKHRSSVKEDEIYPSMMRQRSRDSMVSLKKLSKKSSGQMDEEHRKKRKPKMDLEIEMDSGSDDSD